MLSGCSGCVPCTVMRGQPRWAHSKELAAQDLEPEDVPHVILHLDLLSQFSSSGLPMCRTCPYGSAGCKAVT